MKERHWNSLVTGVRHGQCILVLGPEIPAGNVGVPGGVAANSVAEALTGALATELEEDPDQACHRNDVGCGRAAVRGRLRLDCAKGTCGEVLQIVSVRAL